MPNVSGVIFGRYLCLLTRGYPSIGRKYTPMFRFRAAISNSTRVYKTCRRYQSSLHSIPTMSDVPYTPQPEQIAPSQWSPYLLQLIVGRQAPLVSQNIYCLKPVIILLEWINNSIPAWHCCPERVGGQSERGVERSSWSDPSARNSLKNIHVIPGDRCVHVCEWKCR